MRTSFRKKKKRRRRRRGRRGRVALLLKSIGPHLAGGGKRNQHIVLDGFVAK